MRDHLNTVLIGLALGLSLGCFAPLAQAAAYVFPGNLPSTCTGAGPSYTCTGLTLLSGDTVIINSPTPTTIAVNGVLNATGASINSAGNTADLTLNVTGVVTLTTSSIKANVNSVGATLNTGSSITGNLAAGAATITMAASTTVSGNVSCTGTCYLNMGGNDISIGGTTTVGYLYNWGSYRARFGGTITAHYAYIYIGYDAVINGDVRLLATYANYGYYLYLQDRTVVNGSVSNTQTGGIFLYPNTQVSGDVTINNTAAGGTNVSGNNVYMYGAAKVLGNVACSACQLDIQGNNTDIGGTTSVGLIGNPNNYTSYSGAKFASLSATPSGNTVNASSGQIVLGNTTTVRGGMYASQAITVGNSLNVSGSVTAGGAISLGTGANVGVNLVSSASITTSTSTTVLGSVTAAGTVSLASSAAVTGAISAGSGVSLGTSSTVGQYVSGGSGTVTLTANNSVAGDVSCAGTCYLSMGGNDISIGGTTTVGYLYNWGSYRARFGGNITASYAYIYLGYDAIVNGDVKLLATYANYGYYIYIQDRTVVNGTVSNSQSGGIYHYANSTSQCTRTLTTGTITLNTGARPGGVCCASAGYGSACGSTCVSNSSGLTMPVGCQPPNGLNGSYYNTTDLTGAVALSRRDGPVDFDWGGGSPGTGVNADYFSVRWTGAVLAPSSGWYTFQTQSDDGVRLWVNGQQLVNNWTLHGPTDDTSTTVYLKAGTRYPIEMNMYEWGGGAVARLRWKRPLDAAFTAIPYGDGIQGLYPDTVAVVPDAGAMTGAVWWSRAGSFSGVDSAPMAAWANDADSSRNLSGSTTRPQYRNTNGLNINFNPVVEFTSTGNAAGTAQYFSAASFMGSTTVNQSHVYTVGYATAVNASYLFSEGTYYARVSTHQPWADGVVHWISGNWAGDGKIVSSVIANNQPLLMSFNKDVLSAGMPRTGNMSLSVNGVLAANRTGSSALSGSNASATIGWTSIESVPSWRGVLAEGVYFLNTPLSAQTAAQLESYLAVKYGLTLGGTGATGTAYLNSANSAVWASSTGFHNNIAGIGRDDKMLLDQRISRSVNTGSQITATSKATMPDGTSTVSAQDGVQFSDKSFVIWGDNGLASTSTVNIAAGTLAGRTRSMRLWRLQTTGTLPAQWTVCIPDALLPSNFLSGNVADLQFNASSSSDLSTNPVSVGMSAGNCPGSGVGVTASVPGRVATLTSAQLSALGSVSYFSVTRRLLDHLEITASSSSGVTCAPTTYTIKACADAGCTSVYTGGVSGSLTMSGSGLSVTFPGGAGFSIPNGSSQTTVSAQVTTTGTATVGATGLSIIPGNGQTVFCGLGATTAAGNSCAMTVTTAGLLFSVPNHYAGASPTVNIKAVRSSDNAQVCLPGFANVTRSIKATCSYVNPGTGTLPVRLGAAKLNSGNTNAACDATGQNLNLAFDANGAASTTVQYWDAGRVQLNLGYTGSAGTNDVGLTMSGSAQFIAAPMGFIITDYPSVATAGTPFSFNIKALAFGSNTNVLPNFGRESVPEGATLGWIRSSPLGAGAQIGSFTGTVGSFSAGAAAVSNASWSEVGNISPSARLSSDSYLGSGLTAAGNPTGVMGNPYCTDRNGTCVVPSGLTSTIFFGSGVNALLKSGQSGNVPCTPAYLGEPLSGTGGACYQIYTSGAAAVTTHIQVKPARLEVSAAAACGSFSYAGQAFGVTVTAKNSLGNVTQNYAGSVARDISLSEASANSTGTLTGSVTASTFSSGVAPLANIAPTAPVFNFNAKLTAPQTISLRATDTDGVSSSGYDGSMTLRSGRLQMSNAFGGDKTSLQIPLQLQYWSGKSWVPNSADNCTVIPTASVVRARTLNHDNTAATWSSAVSSVTLSGSGSSSYITLAAPSPSGTGTVDVAINLGTGSSDNSCNSANGSATGAGVPWLRSRQGSCASTYDRDPSARATFGVYTPETKRSVHVRDVF